MPTDGEPQQRTTLRERLARLIAGVPLETMTAVAPEQQPPPAAIRLRLKEFETASVRDVMTSRVDIAAVDVGATLGDVLNLFALEAHSRMPVYRDSLDEPLGFVHIKDVVAEIVRAGWSREALGSRPLERLVRDIMFVPGSTRLPDLLVQMQASRIHIALVVDEYGGTGGMVCLEDLVEQIVGDIEDEHDEARPLILRRGKSVWEVDGLAAITDAERETGLQLAVEDFEMDVDTVGGLVSALAGKVPQAGDQVEHPHGAQIEVIAADPRRVIRIRLRAPRPQPAMLAETAGIAVDRTDA
ncbi:MAG TPA: hemolysin family protein [Hyphomonadaceae bacterium]|nr:hemolysin family protein [Hyphomonadaceae bacterium]